MIGNSAGFIGAVAVAVIVVVVDVGVAVAEVSLAAGVRDVESLERDVRRAAGKFVHERTKRRPMIVPVVMET